MTGESVAKAVQARVEASDGCEAAATPSSLLVHLSRRAMATEFELYLNDHRDQDEMEAALEALDLLEELEDQMSIYRDHSEISEINRSAFKSPQRVEDQLFQLLGQAQAIYEATGGAFDLTSTPLSRLWGFFHRAGRLPSDVQIESTKNLIGGDHVHLDDERQEVSFDLPDIELNLGAIGKGYALDRIAQNVLGAGVTSFLLHGGLSSVRAVGCRDGATGWRIDMKHPLIPARSLGEVNLVDLSLATSGCGNQFFYHRGKRLGHIIDPRSGYPVEWEGGGVHSATAIASEAASADALATAFYVLGPDRTREYCETHAGVGAIFVLPTGRAETETIVVGELDEVWRPT